MSEVSHQPSTPDYDPSADTYGWQDAAVVRLDGNSVEEGAGVEPAPKFVGYARLPELPNDKVVVLDNGVMYTDGDNGDVFYLN